VGPDGRVYVGDHTVRVHVLAPDGSYERFFDYYAGDTGLAMSADGNLLVAGYKIILRTPNIVAVGPRVWRVSPEGREIDSWEGPDDGLVSAWFPMGITEDRAGRVYVTGSRQHREGAEAVKSGEFVWVFDRRGTLINRFGIPASPGPAPPGFEGVAVDSRGAVYVTEWHGGYVYKFSRSGELVMKWKYTSDSVPALTAPVGVLVDPLDRIYVADWSQNLIHKFGYN
jgi:sugar lactone lactonase YvrE